MANLTLLFNEHGLGGIIPYAFGMSGSEYQFLCDKLKAGEPFSIVVSKETGMPFFFVEEGKVYFSLYQTCRKAPAFRHGDIRHTFVRHEAIH